MDNKWSTDPQKIQIQGLIDRFVRAGSVGAEATATPTEHLDADALTAFVEGNLNERETPPVVNHLIKCSFCRHVTAELVKLDLAFAEDSAPRRISETQPSRISEVLSNLLSNIFGTNDSAVFAHEEKTETDDQPTTETGEKD